jgi:hypothetical protein
VQKSTILTTRLLAERMGLLREHVPSARAFVNADKEGCCGLAGCAAAREIAESYFSP